MKKKEEFKKVKEIIKEYYKKADCGIYNTRNWAGDYMNTIFKGTYFIVDICYHYSYFEVFGTTKEEFKELQSFYYNLKAKERND